MSTPTHARLLYVALFRMSRILVDRLDYIRRNFLWDGQSGWRKMHLIEWSIEVKPKFMVDGNWALLAKWRWMLGGRNQGFVEKGNCFQECGGKCGMVPRYVPSYRV